MERCSFTYRDLIGAYFYENKKSFRNFSTDSCRRYVQKYRRDDFDEAAFMGHLALFLQTADDNVSDYSLDDEA